MARKPHDALRTIVVLLLVGGLTALTLLLNVPARVAALGAGNLDRLVRPTTEATYGETVLVAGRAERPPLEVSSTAPRPVRAVGRSLVAKGNRLVATRFTIRNVGDLRWSSETGLESALLDGDGRSYAPTGAVTQVSRAHLLPTGLALRPGQSARGLVVFEVPRGVQIASARLTFGSGLTRSVEWEPTQG